MIILFFVSLAIFIAYNVFAVARVGVPSSLSATYYLLPSPWRHLFTVSLMGAALTLVAPWVEASDEAHKFAAFLACAMLTGVAAAPMFNGSDSVFHQVFAISCAFFALLWVVLSLGWRGVGLIVVTLVLSQCAFFLALGSDGYETAQTYRLEMFAFLTTYLAVGAALLC